MTGSLAELVQMAFYLELPFFQCFFTDRKTGRVMVPRESDMRLFLSMRWVYFNDLYVHASFFINLAAIDRRRHPLLAKEIELAKRLEFTHIVVHPGTVRRHEDKEKGIDAVARMVNYLLKRERDIQFLLENAACGELAVGSTIEDFYLLLTKLDQPDRIGFCIDTVHAHVAGYDIVSTEGYEHFVNLLEKTVGLQRVKLIHLNETCEACGSFLDVHCCVGAEHAALGQHLLKRFVRDKRFADIPMLMELPEVGQEEERRILEKVNAWRQTKMQ